MHKRGLCRRAVSVCPFVCHICVFCRNELTYLQFFLPSGSHIWFSSPNVMAIFKQEHPPLMGASSEMDRQESRFWTIIWLSIDDCALHLRRWTVQFTAQTATQATHRWVYVYYNQHRRPGRREENRIKLYAAVNLKRNFRSTYCTIEATERHEALRGLSATAELLVFS